jgi:hypothetical protein
MMQLTPAKILEALNPTKPPEAMFAAIVCYLIALLAFIALLMQKNATTRDTILLSSIIFMCLIDKITATSTISNQTNFVGFTKGNPFGLFLIRTGMFAIPMIVAGGTKTEKSRPVLILTGLLGGAYLFARWFIEIRPQ